MDTLDLKILKNFPGKVVRKDLTSVMKKGANVPTYVLEYLLGMYCATDDEKTIESGMNKIKQVLSENYVKPDQSEYIKSKIRENGTYTIIDKINVHLDEREDKYIAEFANLKIAPFEVSPDLVINNEKMLIGGIWCILKIEYTCKKEFNEDDDMFYEDIFNNMKRKKATKKGKSRFDSPFSIISLKPIQMPNLNLEYIIKCRKKFTKDEWMCMILRSIGYEPTELTLAQRYHYLLRIVPFVQKNYNLVELGPRGTGKSHVYSEISPYSILMSGGNTSSANLFYNLSRRKVGLVGNWDCIAFDEVGGMKNADLDTIQMMKNFMANGSFARGTESINADASMAFEGNTFRPLEDMLRITNLFEPFPNSFNNDCAFFDRIHAYLPGWETPKLRSSLFTKNYGLISDCLSEYCHLMRKYDFTNDFSQYFSLNNAFNTRDDTAVRKTFSGLAKLLYPDEVISKEDAKELLIYSITVRRRVKEQLRKMSPSEFKDVNLGFIDNETNEEFIVNVPEQPESTLIPDTFEKPGYVYAIGRSIKEFVGVYRLENKIFNGTGKFEQKNIEGLSNSNKSVKDSINAAFNYYKDNCHKLINGLVDDYDYGLYYNDLQAKGTCDEISVAEVVGLCSAIAGRAVIPSLVIVGKVVVSGSMMPVTTSVMDIVSVALNVGAKKILLPQECKEKFERLSPSLTDRIQPIYYTTPMDAARKALGI